MPSWDDQSLQAEPEAVPLAEVAMVGDSSTDTGSSNAAGTVTVLYGPRADLASEADVVLADLASLLDLLDP